MATPPDFTAGAILTAAQMNQVGLWKITTATATTGSVLDVTGIFSSDFDAYKIVLSDIRLSGVAGINAQLTTGTSPVVVNASNWTYVSSRVDYAASALSVDKATANASFVFCVAGTNATGASMEIFNPNLAQNTSVLSLGTDARNATGLLPNTTSGNLANTTQFTGIRFNAQSATTFTNLKVVVYGYRN
jgi:hypothetical protein